MTGRPPDNPFYKLEYVTQPGSTVPMLQYVLDLTALNDAILQTDTIKSMTADAERMRKELDDQVFKMDNAELLIKELEAKIDALDTS